MTPTTPPQLAVIVTDGDTTAERVRAGEALSAVLLHATRLRLATTPLSQATEVAEARRAVNRALQTALAAADPRARGLAGHGAAGDLPATPRRDLRVGSAALLISLGAYRSCDSS